MNNYQYRIPNEHLKLEPIHPSVKFGEGVVLGINVIIGPDVVIGDDCFIGHNTHVRHGTIIGNRVTIRTNCLIDPDCKLGNDIKIMPHAIVGGGCVIEDKVYYGPQCMTANTNKLGFHRDSEADHSPVIIKVGAVLYTACVIKPGITIGMNSIIGQLSNVTKDVPDNEVWMGNPAHKFRDVKDEERVIYSQEKVGKNLARYSEEMTQGPSWPYSARDLKGYIGHYED